MKRIQKYKWGIAVIILVGFILFSLSQVYALGVTPGRTTVNFEPNLEREVSFFVLNPENRDMNVIIAKQGDLEDYIYLEGPQVRGELQEDRLTFNQEVGPFSISSDEEMKEFSYILRLPESLGPGLHTGRVVVLQVPDNFEGSGSQIGATLAVVTQIHVNVPFPGRYAEAELHVKDAGVGEKVGIFIPIKNRGSFDLVNVRAVIDIYNTVGERVDSFSTSPINIPSRKVGEIVSDWEADVAPGQYVARADLIYGAESGETIKLERAFNVGERALELQQVEVNDFQLGSVATFEMLVENKWGEDIGDVYARTEVYDSQGSLMSEFSSPIYDVPALSRSILMSHWNTAGVRVGVYDTRIFLRYDGDVIREDVQLDVSERDIRVIGLGYVISERPAEDGGINFLLGVLVVVLILANVFWFLVFRKKQMRQKR